MRVTGFSRRSGFIQPWLLAATLALGACAGRSSVNGVVLQQGPDARELEALAIAQKGAAAVAVVSTDVGRGLAFVVDPAGYLITNRHVVEDADHVEDLTFPALRPPRTFSRVRIVYIDPQRDLALLKIETDETLPYLTLATGSPRPVQNYLNHADRVLLLTRAGEDRRDGSDGAGFVARTGKVRELEVYNEAVGPGAFFGLTQQVQRGMSGGPVLDRFGRAVGVVSWTWKHRKGGYAIPIAEAAQMLAERPRLDTASQQAHRAEDRARGFVDAIHGGQLDVARRMISPTYARKVRGYTMRTIAEQLPGEGREPVRQFVAALDGILENQPHDGDSLPFSAVQEIVLRTGTDAFMHALGVDGLLTREQVVSFFFEFSQAYVSARFFTDIDRDAAMDAALARLQTVDAARTFAFAEIARRMSTGDDIRVAKIEMIPGDYAPQAVAHVRIAARNEKPVDVVIQLRLEWGDWYVAELQTVGVTG